MLAGALVIAGALTRSIGVVLILTALFAWAIKRRWLAVGWLAFASALTVGVWLGWTAMAPAQLAGQSYLGDATQVSPAPAPAPVPASTDDSVVVEPRPPSIAVPAPPSPAETRPTSLAATLVARVRHNLPGYVARGLPQAIEIPAIPGTRLDNWGWLVVLGCFGLVGTWHLARAERAMAIT